MEEYKNVDKENSNIYPPPRLSSSLPRARESERERIVKRRGGRGGNVDHREYCHRKSIRLQTSQHGTHLLAHSAKHLFCMKMTSPSFCFSLFSSITSYGGESAIPCASRSYLGLFYCKNIIVVLTKTFVIRVTHLSIFTSHLLYTSTTLPKQLP